MADQESSGPASVLPATNPSSGTRLAGIEGMRALAAWAIVAVHVYGFATPGGALEEKSWIGEVFSTLSVGVTLFFTLSGFLLYRPFAAAIARGVPHMPIGSYLRNRALRIVPAYWVILAIAALVLGTVNIRDASGALLVGRMTGPGDLLSTALLLQDYRPSTMVIGIGPAWSLAVEIVFYLALPLLVLGVARAARGVTERRKRALLLLGPPLFLLILGLSGKYATHQLPGSPTAGYNADWHSVIERSFWAQADLFSFGMAVAVFYSEVIDGQIVLPPHWRRIAVSLGLLIFIPCAITMHRGEHSYLPQNTGEALGISLVFAALMLPGRTGVSAAIVRWLERPWVVAAGVASYSVFLWHHPLINWLVERRMTFAGWGGLLVNMLMVSIVTAVLSAITYRFVELPALRRKSSVRRAP